MSTMLVISGVLAVFALATLLVLLLLTLALVP